MRVLLLIVCGVSLCPQVRAWRSNEETVRLTEQRQSSDVDTYAPILLPRLSLGTGGYNDSVVEAAILTAFDVGFRGVHTAFDYYNLKGVRRALDQLPRSEVFVTAMTSPCVHVASQPVRNVTDVDACEKLTSDEIEEMITSSLGLEYVDLLLLHGPSESFGHHGTCNASVNALNGAQWRAYRDAMRRNRTRSIGVSNFCPSCLSAMTNPTPSVNQVQWHVGMGNDPDHLMSYCEARGIVVQAYSPLAAGEVATNCSVCSAIGRKYNNRSAAEVGLRWVTSQAPAAVVKAHRRDYLEDDLLRTFDWNLTREDTLALSALTEPKGQQNGHPSWGCTA